MFCCKEIFLCFDAGSMFIYAIILQVVPSANAMDTETRTWGFAMLQQECVSVPTTHKEIVVISALTDTMETPSKAFYQHQASKNGFTMIKAQKTTANCVNGVC